MLSDGQTAHFQTFGFLRLPGLFADELAQIERVAEEIWAQEDPEVENQEQRLNQFVERSPYLTKLAVDDRLHTAVTQLFGEDFIWVGSEGNVSGRPAVNWHADRKYYRDGEARWMDYPQGKLMLYLDPVTRQTGCLRVIPGSHRLPLHADLAQQEVDAASRPFGVDGPDLPCAALESTPGDGLLFHHCLWHAAYGGSSRRRYVAMKFAARPRRDDQLISLERYTPNIFEPHAAFAQNEHARVRRMVDPLLRYGETGRV
jgi:hypothetical protein